MEGLSTFLDSFPPLFLEFKGYDFLPNSASFWCFVCLEPEANKLRMFFSILKYLIHFLYFLEPGSPGVFLRGALRFLGACSLLGANMSSTAPPILVLLTYLPFLSFKVFKAFLASFLES